MRTAIGLLLLLSGTVLPAAAQPKELDTRIEEARAILAKMDLEPEVVRSKHFYILFIGERGFAELRRENLELTYRNLRVFMQNQMRMRLNLRHDRLLVILLDTQEQMLTFGRLSGNTLSRGVAGYYVPARNWSVFFNQRKSESLKDLHQQQRHLERLLADVPDGGMVTIQTARGRQRVTKERVRHDLREIVDEAKAEMRRFNIVVTQHEGAHHIAHNVGVQHRGADYPFWVSEGLACLFETPPRARGAAVQGAGKTNQDRLAAYRRLVRDAQHLGLRKLIRNPKGAQAAVDVDAAYAESWATYEFLFRRHATKLRNYMQHLSERSEDLKSFQSDAPRRRNGKVDELVIFEQHFGPIDELQEQMDEYFERLK